MLAAASAASVDGFIAAFAGAAVSDKDARVTGTELEDDYARRKPRVESA